MQVLKYIIVGIPFVALFTALVILGLGPAYLEFRDWLRKGGHF
jgi:hypothetical protein